MAKAQVANYYGACLLCRQFIKGKAVMIGFDGLCLKCVEDIARAAGYLQERSTPEPETAEVAEEEPEAKSVEESPVRVCKKCGKEFSNVGKFLAHTKVCGKEGTD